MSDQWVTVDKAMKVLGKSERSIQRLVQAGALQQQRAGVDGHTERLYSARDLARIKAEGISTTAALVRVPVRFPPPSPLALAAPISRDGETNPAPNALWLSIEQAAEMLQFSESFIRSMIHEGTVAAVKAGPNGAWRIRRKSLEEYAG